MFTGFPLYLENIENLEFCYLLFQAWKMHKICSKIGEKLEFKLQTWKKPFKISKFSVLWFTFQDVIDKK